MAELFTTDFPIYSVCEQENGIFHVAGGGGKAKTGIPNILEVRQIEKSRFYFSDILCRHNMSDELIRQSTSSPNDSFTLAASVGKECHIYHITDEGPKTDDKGSDEVEELGPQDVKESEEFDDEQSDSISFRKDIVSEKKEEEKMEVEEENSQVENQTGGIGFASGTTQSGNSGGMNFDLQSGNGFGIAPQFWNQAGGTGINLSNQQTTLVPKPPVTSSNFQFSFPSNVQSQQSQQINLFNQSNQSSNPPVFVPQNIFAFGNQNVSTNTSSLAVPTSSSTVQLGPSSKGGFQFSLTNNTSFSSNVPPQASFGKSLFNQQSSIQQQQQKPSLQFGLSGKQNSTKPQGNSVFNFGQKQQSQISSLQMPQQGQGQTQSPGLQFNFQKPPINQNQSGNNLSTTSGGFNFGSGSSGQGQSLSFGGGNTGSVGNTPQQQTNLFDPTAKLAFNFSIGSSSSNKKQLDFGNTGNSGNTGAGMFNAGTGNNMSSFQNGQLNQSTPSMFQFGSQTSGTNQSNHVFNSTNPDSKPQFQFGGNVSTNQNKFQFNIGGGGQPIQQPTSFTNNKPMFPFPSSSNTQMSVSQQNNTGFNFAAVPSNVGVNVSVGMNGKTIRPVASARRRRKN